MSNRINFYVMLLYFFGCKSYANECIVTQDTYNENFFDINFSNERIGDEHIEFYNTNNNLYCDKINEAKNDVSLPTKAKKPYYFFSSFKGYLVRPTNKAISEEITIWGTNGKQYKFQIFECEDTRNGHWPCDETKDGKLINSVSKTECRCFILRLNYEGQYRWLILQSLGDLFNLKIKKHKLLNEEVIIVSGAVPDIDKKNRLLLYPKILIIRIDDKRNNAYVYLQIQLFTGNGMEPSDKKLDLCDPEYECDIKVVDTDGNKKGEFLIKGKGDQCAILKCRETIADIGYESCTGTIHGGPQDGEEMWAFMNLYDEELDWLLLFMPQ